MNTEQNLTTFNERVERLRTVTGRTWADMAAALRVSRTMLHYYRNGQHSADASVLYRLGEAERRAGLPVPGMEGGRGFLGPAFGGADAGDRHEILRRLRGLLAQQRDVIAAAQRQSREIEQWITEVEFADADDFPVRESTGSRRGSADATRLRDVASISLPVFGHLPAGWPQTREGVAQQQPTRTASVARGRFPEGAFGLDVRGDSMNAAAPSPIQDGDTVVLLPPELRSPQVGDVVAALIDGETCLKRLVRGAAAEAGGREEHHLRSESTNPVHGEIYPVHELVIQGVLVGKL